MSDLGIEASSAEVRGFSVEEAEGAGALLSLAPEWDALVARSPEPTPFLRARWLHAWWEAFGRGRAWVVTVRDAGRQLVGAALFSERRARFHGLPIRLLTLASDVNSNRADLVVDAGVPVSAGAALARWVHERRARWTVCFLDHVPADSIAVVSFLSEMERLGYGTWIRPRERQPLVRLQGGLAAFEKTLTTKWKSNLRNRRKRLAATGVVAHETIRERTPDLAARLDECFALEARAWKGEAGSAILSAPATLAFYRAIAQQAAETGTLALQTLRTNGKLAAFQLDLRDGAVEYVLKIGYEPELRALSPGGLLLQRVIEDACAHGLSAVDLLGDDMPWKRDWTATHRHHVRVLVFARGATGKVLELVETEALPRARHWRDTWRARGDVAPLEELPS